MSIKRLFDGFSRRNRHSQKPAAPLTPEFRNRVVMLCREKFPEEPALYARKGFWEEIHERLRYLVGTQQLSSQYVTSPFQDTFYFLAECSDEHFLEFVEAIFKTETFAEVGPFRHSQGNEHMLDDINTLFLADNLAYTLTPFVWEHRRQMFYGIEQDAKVIAAYPQVIRREDEMTHTWAVEPTLTLLRDKSFTSANKEFIEALEDYRKGDYGDCLTKCGSSFESTMKIICDRNKWPYKQTDTAAPLLKRILNNSQLDPSIFEQSLINIATIRNKLSKSHGSGVQQKNIPQHVAKYAINATAAAILLIVEECL
jgi:hypothetical protein